MKAAKAGVLSALLAAACCGGPLLLVAIGLGGGAVFFARYHWFFLVGGLVVLTGAWVNFMREKVSCDCQSKPLNGRKATLAILLVSTTVVLGFAGLSLRRPSVPAGARQQAPGESIAVQPGAARAVFPIEGMSCMTCEISVRSALSRVPGVKFAQVSFATSSATVEFDPKIAKPEQLAEAINSTGYRTSLPSK